MPEAGSGAVSKIDVQFKDDSFYPQIRRKYFTIIDWFSFVGGVLGLFFGFSFLSGFEIVFHACLGISRQNDVGLAIIARTNEITHKTVEYLQNFLRTSSIHGLKYVLDSKLRIYERSVSIVSIHHL